MSKDELKKNLLVFFALLLLIPGMAVADVIQGSVNGASPMGIELTVYDQQGRPFPNALYVRTDDRTRLNGVDSTAALQNREIVEADIRQSEDGQWRADSITRLQTAAVGTAQAVPVAASKSPSNPLMDALRSPKGQAAIRNGLTGAVVGGVASATSGGKAGKGALIGAGTGVAAGFLTDLFTQGQGSPKPQVDDDHRR